MSFTSPEATSFKIDSYLKRRGKKHPTTSTEKVPAMDRPVSFYEDDNLVSYTFDLSQKAEKR